MKKVLLFLVISLMFSGFDGKAQTALIFDGVDDYVQTAYSGISQSEPRSFQAWINVSVDPTEDMCMLDYGYDEYGARCTFMVNDDGNLEFDGNGEILTAPDSIPIGSWVHVAFVYDGTDGFLYQDGVQVATGPLDLDTPEENPLRIGQNISGEMPFAGMIDEVSVWDVDLSQQDVIDYACINDPLSFADIEVYYDFNDGTGTTLTELRNGFDGTLMNMAEDAWVPAEPCETQYTIAFVVTTEDGVTPIKNAAVTLDGELQYTNESGEVSYLAFSDTYDYTVSRPGYFDETGSVEVVDADVTVDVSMTLNGVNYAITFVVTDDLSGDPVEGAMVDIDGVQQYTNESGVAVFAEYITETYNYTITSSEYYEQSGSVEVVDADVTVNVALAPYVYYDVTFTVTENAGATPVENALVLLNGLYQYTDASGETTFNLLPESYSYTITKADYYIESGVVDVIDEDVAVLVNMIVPGSSAIEFDGSNEYVQTECPGVTGNNPRTFMAWIYRPETVSGTRCILDYGANNPYSRNTFMVNSSGYLAYLSGGSGSGITADVASVPVNEWVQVAYVYDGSDAFLYQNGEQVGAKTLVSGVNTPSGQTNVRIGQRVAGGSIPFDGLIDEVKIWDVALTPEQLIEYACIEYPLLYTNLVSNYDFNEGEGVTMHDVAGGYYATLLNMEEEDWVDSEVCGSVSYNITFVVTENDGVTPIENAEVELDGAIKYTNASGETVFYFYNADTYDYTISKIGYVDQTGSVEVVDDDVTVNVSMELTGITYGVTFVVTDEVSGDPVEDALVELDGQQQYTDEFGQTVFTEFLPGTYDYSITNDEYYAQSGSVEVIEEDVTVNTSFAPILYFDITFVVTDDLSGDPVEDAMIEIDGLQQYTDELGQTVFAEYLPGTYNYAITKGEYYGQSGSVEVIDADVTENVALAPYVYYDVTFTVTEEAGATPVENALVELDGVQQYTDASGATTFNDLLPANYSYFVSQEGFYVESGVAEIINDDVTVAVSMIVPVSTALEFDGSNAYVQTTCPGVSGNDPRTLMAWIYLDEASSGTRCIMDYGANNPYARNTFTVNGSGFLSYLSGGAGSGITADVASVPINEWVQVAFVYDSVDAFLYQNGVQVGTKTLESGVNSPSGETGVRIGQRVAGGSIPFDGLIDEVMIWDVALTPEQLTEYACIEDPSLYPNLISNYDFNEGAGVTLHDVAGGYYGTLLDMEDGDWVASEVCGSVSYNITFVVTEDDGVTPIENAEVDLDGEIKYTDASGQSVFNFYTPGAYDYTVSITGYVDETGSVEVVDADVTVNVSMELTGLTYGITFMVTDDVSGDPVEDALVDLDGQQQYTDEFGETVFTGNIPGTYNYSITNDEYYAQSDSVEVIDEDVAVSISLAPMIYYDITFVVTDDLSGDPIEDALVDLDGQQQYTDEFGQTVFAEFLPGTYNYSITKAEYYEQSGSVEVIDEDVTSDILLAPYIYYDITFVVTEQADATPVENALVELDGVQQYTDGAGTVTFNDLLPAGYSYFVSKESYYVESGIAELINDDLTVEISMIVPVSTALTFDGINEYVQTSSPGVSGNNARTLMAWIYLDAAGTGTRCIMDYGSNDPYSRNTFMVNSSGYLSYLSGGAGSGITADVATVPIEEWVQVAFVYNSTDAFLYQNGIQVGTKTLESGVNSPIGETGVRFGQRVDGGNIPFIGMIDEVKIWDVALTQEELAEYACIDDPSMFPNLISSYDFNEGAGTILHDVAGGFNGTLLEMEEEDWAYSDICEVALYDVYFVVTGEDATTPIENASVTFDGDMLYTDENGAVAYYLYTPGTYNYTISKPGYLDETGSVEVVDGDVTVNVSMTLSGINYDITFVVTDDVSGDPVVDAMIDLDGEQLYTNESGVAVFAEYIPETYDYSISKDEYYGQNGSVEVIDEDVTVNISFAPVIYYDVTFIATDEITGNPIENALVEMDGLQQTTDASGMTTFIGYLPGSYNYSITKEGHFPVFGDAVVIDANLTLEEGMLEEGSSALEFDGENDLVQTTFPGIFERNPRTIQAWIYLDEAPGSNLTITDYAINTTGARNTFMVNGNGYLAYLAGGANAGITATEALVPIGSWVHVAFVYDSLNGFLYQDGEQVGTGDLSGVYTPTGGENLKIGQRVLGGSIPFKGKIDAVAVWDVALSQQDVINYACIDDPSVHDSLVAYYNFNEEVGTTLHDLIAGNNGTLTNMDEEDWVDSNVCGSDSYNITFVVTQDDGTTPIESATVELDGEIRYTDVNGETVFQFLEVGTYDYTISKPGYYDETGSVELVDDDVTVDVSMTLTGVNYDITFVVTDDETGDPVEDALVELDGQQQYTNELGETAFVQMLPGTYDYSITKSDYYDQSGSVEVVDEDVTVNISLAPIIFYDITFVVTDETSGDPIEDALVDLGGVQQYTNESGNTTFAQYLPGTYYYTITKDGYFVVSDEVQVIDEHVTLDVILVTDGASALEFDGVDDYVQTTFTGIFENNPRSIMAWIYLDETPGSTMCISDYGLNTTGARNTFIVNGDGYLAYLAGGTNAGVTATVATVPIGVWVQVAFVFDGVNGYLYQKGEQVGEALLSGVSTPTEGENFKIGQRVSGGSIPFSGKIDAVSVWDAALSAEEVIDFSCLSDPAQYENLLAYYDFNEAGGTTLTDLAGGNDGTLMNMDEDDWVPSDVCVDEGYNIKFVVTEEDGTTPIENAEVDLDGMIKYTDANGEAVYYYNSPDTYSYAISKANYDDETGTVEVVDDDVTVDVSLISNVTYYAVTFVVTDADVPLENALVDFGGVQQFTDASGQTTFSDVLPETYSYNVSKDGYYSEAGEVEVIDQDVTVEVDLLVTGMLNKESVEVSVYPNPTDGIVHISLANDNGCKVVVNDISGRIIDTFILNSSDETIDLSGVQEGVYFLEIQMNDEVVTLPLVVK